MAAIAAASLSTISFGVFFGATMPLQPLASKPAIVSPMVGTSGSSAMRAAVVTPSARSLPALIWPMPDEMPPTAGHELAAEQVGDHLILADIGHVHDVDAGHHLEQARRTDKAACRPTASRR